MESTNRIRVDFKRDGSAYYAIFHVTREASGTTYHLHAEVFDHRDHLIFDKERSGLDYSQIEYALTFVFHQAFVEE
ncbi:MAG: hypothetical protein AAB588_01605 [Patescibacteria group bacterium]